MIIHDPGISEDGFGEGHKALSESCLGDESSARVARWLSWDSPGSSSPTARPTDHRPLSPGVSNSSPPLRHRSLTDPANLSAWQELGARLPSGRDRNRQPVLLLARRRRPSTRPPPSTPATRTRRSGWRSWLWPDTISTWLPETATRTRRARTRSIPRRCWSWSTPRSSLGQYEEAAFDLQRLLDLKPALPALSRTSYLRELHGDLRGAEEAMIQALTAGSRSELSIWPSPRPCWETCT